KLVSRTTRHLLLESALAYLIMAAMIMLLLRLLVTRPLRRVMIEAHRIGEGDLTTPIDLRAKGEIGELESTLDMVRRKLERSYAEVQQQNEELKRLDQAKAAFFANMSHEIRTPLTSVLGFTDLMLLSDMTEQEIEDSLRTVRNNGRHLLALINNILDFSKIDADHMVVESIECSLPALLAEVASIARPLAIQKKIDFDVELASPIPALIRSDPVRLKQVMLNLTSNAIKFTETGRVVVRVRENGSSDDGTLTIEVEDTGIGIQPSAFQAILKPFEQADESTTRRFGGTGLGLAISSRLITLLGGELEISSLPGQGSTFRVRLPGSLAVGDQKCSQILPEQATPTENGAQTRQPLEGHVLLADDARDNQLLIGRFLESLGLRVTIAEDGAVACEKAIEAMTSSDPFDLILMDVQMPRCDGLTATRRIREFGYSGPIVALTANAFEGDRKLCLDAGCDDYATKPVDWNALYATLKAQVGAKERLSRS
ncbi:MAG: response regulator, partial [Planctomycetes bacterium]|nr:response regulator [Planctomycetota bacterium]